MQKKYLLRNQGFTLVELMIVVLIIGILTTLIMVSLDNTKMTARNTRRLADIKQIQLALKMYYNDTGMFPTSITPGSSIARGGSNYMLRVPQNPKPWADNGCPDQDYQYKQLENGQRYSLSFCVGDTTDDLSKGTHMATANGILDCPTGYVGIPGSATYETNDFCVMKYEAKCAADINATSGLSAPATSISTTYNDATSPCTSPKMVASFAGGLSIGNISQVTAKARCAAIGAHLITNAEWMTIAKNIEQVATNWSGGIVGSGEISRGHYNNNLTAMPDGSTTHGTGGATHPYKRDLTLLSGDTIKDFSGNMAEWVDNTCQGSVTNAPGYYYRDAIVGSVLTLEWTSAFLDDYERPASGPTSSSYSSTNGIGQYTECSLDNNAFLRGGGSDEILSAGIFSLNLRRDIYQVSNADYSPNRFLYGFRCVK